MEIGNYVNRKDTTHPTGIVEAIIGDKVTVRWGVQDKHEFREEIPAENLQIVKHSIQTPDEVDRAQAKASGLPYHEVND